jgi:hypothetical protein
LARLGEGEAGEHRERYWTRVAEWVPDVKGKVVVDKLPLATVALPLVAKLFPRAKVLFALRDPRDVVLSCFRHAFEMNDAMYEFTTLEGTARFYDCVMRLAQRYFELLPLHVHRVRNEDLVDRFDEEAKAACAHIELPWAPEMRDFAKRASSRVIRTPSGAQVRRGLNKDGFAQWRAYEEQLAPVFPLLAPWVEAYGYQ